MRYARFDYEVVVVDDISDFSQNPSYLALLLIGITCTSVQRRRLRDGKAEISVVSAFYRSQ